MIEKVIAIREIDVYVSIEGDNSLPAIVFLHGFSGSTQTWSEVTFNLQNQFHVVCIDLIGHGNTTAPADYKRYRMEEQTADLESIFEQLNLKSFTLVGYSMGGRVALAYTSDYPKRVSSLILESASPGLASLEDRSNRKKSDEKLAAKIVNEGIESFVTFWEDIPLFDSQKRLSQERRSKVRDERMNQQESGLANSLLGIGTGSQPSYWGKLQTITIPVLLITGGFDKKFIRISQEMKQFIPKVQELTVNDAGHAIHVEKPTLFATMIKEYLLKGN